MMAEPMKTLELHYPMIQFLIIAIKRWSHYFVGQEKGGNWGCASYFWRGGYFWRGRYFQKSREVVSIALVTALYYIYLVVDYYVTG